MKIRKTFVTNSSSASFVIVKKFMDDNHEMIFREVVNRMENLNKSTTEYSDWWDIDEDDRYISGFTIMDNSWLSEELEKAGFDMDLINIEGD